MGYPGTWELSQQNLITFVIVNAAMVEIPGLGVAFNLFVSKAGGAFAPSAGVKAEISNGWYRYLSTAAEANTVGPVSVYITAAGAIQQNLEYVVVSRVIASIEFTYTVTNIITGLPIPGVNVWFTTDIAGLNVVWAGLTDSFGIAKDLNDNLPRLDVGVYYVWRQKAGFVFSDPDTETVS
jgi:hypothetical protein